MTSTGAPWLTIVGIGEDGWDDLSPAARAAVTGASLLVGGARHLGLVRETAGQERLAWPSPLGDAFPTLLARRGQAVTVLASGDPQWFGIGATLARLVPPAETRVFPAPGAFTLAAARLGWGLQDVACLSLHGRPLEAVIPHLFPGARLLLLSWDGTTPAKLAVLLRERGFGPSTLTVLEAMGGPRERISVAAAEAWPDGDVLDLNTIALTCAVTPGARVLPRSPGLPDDWFQHDGKITKREVRAVALSHLAPGRGEMLWDVGAGSGSIAIEWLLADPANRAVAVEDRADRMAAIHANALTFGVPNLDFREGAAPDALADLPQPDAVFIGGGLTGAGVVEACWRALRPGGRLVATAVTLETEAALSQWHTALGGSLTRLSVERAVPLGSFRGWRPLMPVTLWRVEKPL
ncbi:precorrin-6y C5,15-methyltransferase (decarboxylating) subunit CbiE [Nitrospirillum sp. BR 11163]|uniref:precorrin-6y C5,15-methyltransferase (decarboxylating) subunit CbiE n=1 Tax=Nitrospirillum sp. BR 11163 TaxID=3104323 RepID=UPI002B0036D3|nr:precorrin-6y C5,15-methyltransferase (decarboxylating) subunit CbiE [Nitrospirillum sp. BR 11163]MEA1673515.1 precorrin-6y C5,15-methyltransferase (decarboxylating) subunit CbiE [Nitrospirillum sp. BR 11163]